MEKNKELFLQALCAALRGQQVEWEQPLEAELWQELFRMAQIHKVLPMVYEAVYSCAAAKEMGAPFFLPFKQQVMRSVMLQTMVTEDFLSLMNAMNAAGAQPMVVKGIICRELYPNPDCRVSGDEDVFAPGSQFDLCRQVMENYGMTCADERTDTPGSYEVPFGKQGSPLYIELHKSLFPPKSGAYGDFNRYFENALADSVIQTIHGVPVRTMGPTDHLFYLICHSLKHFLHSGFGIRQVCDICMFAERYGAEIDWERLVRQCEQIRGDVFAAALFRIGGKYLGISAEDAGLPREWAQMDVDEAPMLEDLLDAGVYGNGSMSRRHSSNITLSAVSAEKQGSKKKSGIMRSLFPPRSFMEKRYPYLKEQPYLLPKAWAERIKKYRNEVASGESDGTLEAVKIGNKRVELLKEYGILSE